MLVLAAIGVGACSTADESLVLNATAGNGSTYSAGMTMWLGGITDGEWITASGQFRYLRFCALTNSRDESLCVASTHYSNYWNLAELHFYGK